MKTDTFEKGTLWNKVIETSWSAINTGSILSIKTHYEIIPDGGIDFCVRILTSQDDKEIYKTIQQKETIKNRIETDPFTPYDEQLYITSLGTSHICLLNKFTVIDNHTLIVTREFEDQRSLLTEADFLALALCMGEYPGLGFYNSGKEAGASQRHKHLQYIPLPLSLEGTPVPVEALLLTAPRNDSTQTIPQIPFKHAVGFIECRSFDEPLESSHVLYRLYRELLCACDVSVDCRFSGERPQNMPYNLLLTRDWMMIVPRSSEHINGISVNSLGFAGGLLVKNETELKYIKKHRPVSILQSVGIAL